MEEEVFIQSLIDRSRAAQAIAERFTQRKVDELAAAIVYTFSRSEVAERIARMALDEAHMGFYDSKIKKMSNKIPAVFYDIKDQKTVGVVERIPEKGLIKIVKPVGVIAALIPSTNPESTPLFYGILGLRACNAIIFAPHPSTKKTTTEVVRIMRELLEKNRAPADLFICIEDPSKAMSQELMRQCDLVMATGSQDMVRAAYSSGKPAYGVGTGNAPVVVDETADLADAAQKIRIGKTADNASGCSCENAVVIQGGIYDRMLDALEKEGGYLCGMEEKQRLQEIMWINGVLNRRFITQPIERIAEMARINLPIETKFVMVEETGTGPQFPFSGEKLSLVLTVYKYDEFDEAIDLVNRIHCYMGKGHSCGIHSFNQGRIEKYGRMTKTARVTVRQNNGGGNAGAWNNGLAQTVSLGCGTWGGNIASENITQKHFMNFTLLSEPIDRQPATEEEIFGDLLHNVVL